MEKKVESIEPEDILNDIYYNCTECPNLIEIMLIDEDKSSIKFQCVNKEKSHEREKMKKKNKKKYMKIFATFIILNTKIIVLIVLVIYVENV